MPPSHWLEVTSPSPSVLLFLRGSHKDLQEAHGVIRHLWHLLICLQLSSLPQHLSLKARPLTPGPKLMDHGQHMMVRCHTGQMWQSCAAARASPILR